MFTTYIPSVTLGALVTLVNKTGCFVFMALEANSGDGHCETAYTKGPLKSSIETHQKKGILYPYSKGVLREITFTVR